MDTPRFRECSPAGSLSASFFLRVPVSVYGQGNRRDRPAPSRAESSRRETRSGPRVGRPRPKRRAPAPHAPAAMTGMRLPRR